MDKKNLTNKIGGYESSDFGRMDLNQIIGKYSSKKVDIVEKVLLITPNKGLMLYLSNNSSHFFIKVQFIFSAISSNRMRMPVFSDMYFFKGFNI